MSKSSRASSAASIEIADCTYSAFRSFLLYLYTDRIEPPPRTADDLIGKDTCLRVHIISKQNPCIAS